MAPRKGRCRRAVHASGGRCLLEPEYPDDSKLRELFASLGRCLPDHAKNGTPFRVWHFLRQLVWFPSSGAERARSLAIGSIAECLESQYRRTNCRRHRAESVCRPSHNSAAHALPERRRISRAGLEGLLFIAMESGNSTASDAFFHRLAGVCRIKHHPCTDSGSV